MKIEKENLEINNEKKEFYILCYYEGIKEEVNLDQNYLLVWYDYKKNGEFWFLIKANQEQLNNYLSNKLPLLNLIESSKVYLYERNYANYDKLVNGSDITLSLDEYNLPDSDAYLGRNFLEFLGINISTINYDWVNKSIMQSLLPGIVPTMPIDNMSFTTTVIISNPFDTMWQYYADQLIKSPESDKLNDESEAIAA